MPQIGARIKNASATHGKSIAKQPGFRIRTRVGFVRGSMATLVIKVGIQVNQDRMARLESNTTSISDFTRSG